MTSYSPLNRPLANLPPGGRLAVARSVACSRMPYFTSGLMNLVPRAWGGPTFALTDSGIMLINYDILGQMTPAEAATEVLHEYMHDFFKHGARFMALVQAGVLTRSCADRHLWNTAADAELNDNIVEAGLPFSKVLGAPVTPQALGMEPHQTAEVYARELVERRRSQDLASVLVLNGCGSVVGNPAEGEPPPTDPEARAEVELDVSRSQAAQGIRSVPHGKAPQGLQRWADALVGPSKVPWPQKLATCARNGVAFRPGAFDYTYSEPSRWAGAFSGMSPQPVLPSMHAPSAEVAFVFDTSGSMSEQQLNAGVRESLGVLKALGGARITVIACDATVHEVKKTRDVGEIRQSLRGGGGTDFRPAFDAAMALRPKPDLVVFFTDGYGSYPEQPPAAKVIWLCVGGSIGVDWGETIEIDAEELGR